MDFYMNMTIGAEQTCTAEGASTATTVTLSNILDPAKADSLPGYIQGPYYKHGRIATDVVLYAPVGQTIENVTVNGKTVTPNYSGEHVDRSVAKISVTTDPGTQTAIGYTLTGGADADAAPLDFWHTPMVRETPVDVARCE